MTTSQLVFTGIHFAFFIYMRFKYVRKFKKAREEKNKFEIENLQLRSKIETLNSFIEGYEQ